VKQAERAVTILVKHDELDGRKLQVTITKLPPDELTAICQRFLRFNGDRWDERIEKVATSAFRECYQPLPVAIQQLAEENYELVKAVLAPSSLAG
jgi:hypothetical protein